MELEPIIVTSIGASSWGASNPDFTWLDMESELYQKGLIHYRSKAVSIGGGGDRGRGLSRKGRSLLKEAIKRNSKISESDKKMDFIHESHLSASIDRRLDIYSEMERSRRKSIKVYINIGGGIASLGSSQNGKLIKAGLSRDLTAVEFPAEGVITRMAERGLPIIHILQIRRIANDYGISVMPYLEEEKSKIGKGALYYRETYSLPFTIAAILFLLTVIVLSLRLDVKHYIFQRKKS
ncbi:MAG: hypothetical protein B6244_08985 [Candidatus Cloacimonetes bacterium 4572_55]|nr:MAG: hypothetical protein B6244_08985 [Candidatus Cloacimonetes bacterium 4572_55]